MTQENKVTMMTVRELARTGLLTEHADVEAKQIACTVYRKESPHQLRKNR